MKGTASARRHAPWVLFAMALLALTATAAADEQKRCIRAELPRTVVLPDGSVHEPGLLRICMARKYSPVAGLHETYVDGAFSGMFVSRVGKSEGPIEQNDPFLLFRPNERRQWELEGYALPDGDGLVTYRLQTRSERSTKDWIADHGPPPVAPSGWVVLLAADVR